MQNSSFFSVTSVILAPDPRALPPPFGDLYRILAPSASPIIHSIALNTLNTLEYHDLGSTPLRDAQMDTWPSQVIDNISLCERFPVIPLLVDQKWANLHIFEQIHINQELVYLCKIFFRSVTRDPVTIKTAIPAPIMQAFLAIPNQHLQINYPNLPPLRYNLNSMHCSLFFNPHISNAALINTQTEQQSSSSVQRESHQIKSFLDFIEDTSTLPALNTSLVDLTSTDVIATSSSRSEMNTQIEQPSSSTPQEESNHIHFLLEYLDYLEKTNPIDSLSKKTPNASSSSSSLGNRKILKITPRPTRSYSEKTTHATTAVREVFEETITAPARSQKRDMSTAEIISTTSSSKAADEEAIFTDPTPSSNPAKESSSLAPRNKKTKSKTQSILDHFKLLEPRGLPWVERNAIKYAKSFSPLSKSSLLSLDKINDEIIENGIPSNLSLVKINQQINYGVFLKPDAEPIKPNTLIGIYSGNYEIIGLEQPVDCEYVFQLFIKDEQEESKIKLNHETIKHASYPRTANEDDDFYLHINADTNGNFTRFINHASSSSNVAPTLIKLQNGHPTIAFFSTETIDPGSQLLYNYGSSYWREKKIIPSQVNPKTYTLQADGSLVEMAEEESLNEEYCVKVSDKLLEAITPKTTVISKALLTKCINWEKTIEEGLLPEQFKVVEERRKSELYLNESAKVIKNGSFVATLCGTMSSRQISKNDQLILEKPSYSIYFHPSEVNCGFESLPVSNTGNLTMNVYQDSKDDSIRIVLSANRDIQPGEALSLKTFHGLF
jgi:hypothetical protein